jgi:protein-L-isoaspartate(D-aspartate) O-methyltransferase
MTDTPRHLGLRRELIQLLQTKGIGDPNVLQSLLRVPRHLFMESGFEGFAYQDNAFPIGAGQTISQPYTVGFQSQLLEAKPGMKVLEIGTGSGYQTAVLVEMGLKVYSIERIKSLFDSAKEVLLRLNYKAFLKFGDGYAGWPEEVPFDRILVTAGAPSVPKALIEQLAIGGRLVIPVGEGTQKMTLVTRMEANRFEKKVFGDFRFVPMLNKRD